MQVSAGGVYDLGYHVVWRPKCRRLVRAGQVAARYEELSRAKPRGRGWGIVVLEIVPDHVHLFARAHPSHSPARITNQFGSFISRWLWVRFLHLRSRQTTRRSWFYSAATGAVPAVTVRRYIGARYERAQQGKKAGYPRFKPYGRFRPVGFVAGDGAKWTPAPAGGWARAAFQAVGAVKVRQHRPVPGRSSFCSSSVSTAAGMPSSSPRPSRCRCTPPADRSGWMWGSPGSSPPPTARSSPTPSSFKHPPRRSRISSGARNIPATGRATVSGSVGGWPANGGRSATGATTSTTRPPAPS
jgi:putative transposase